MQLELELGLKSGAITPKPIINKIWDSLKIIEDAVIEYRIDAIYGLFSGGHDSLVNAFITSKHPKFKGVLHIDTGTGIRQTQEYVMNTCAKLGWNLEIYRATEYKGKDGILKPQIYRDLVLKWGFPGAAYHQRMYDRLKDLPIGQFVREKPKLILGLSTGTRKEESLRRTKNMNRNKQYQKEGRRIWINPIADWTKDDCEQLMLIHKLPRNPVKDNLCMSGECLCGAFAKKNELVQIEIFYPEKAQEIRALEKEVRDAGFPWGWEDSPPYTRNKNKQYQELEEKGQQNLFAPLCSSCQFIFEKFKNE
jgi:3'-phosphoadenosine 5'-phosphosulfate sulfotransferase (PAPS reductase)/FAD synthetase